MLKRIITAALLASGVIAAIAAPVKAELADIIASGKIRIGVPVDVSPFGFVDDKQQPAGLDVDVARMLAEALGVKLEMQQITGANRIPFLMTNKVDLVISAMGATPERARQIAFSSPYSALSIGVFGPKSAAVKQPGDIGAMTVGVARGTTQDVELTALAPTAKIMRFDDDATAAAAYLSGQVDLFATANVVAIDLGKKNPGKEFETKFIIRFSPTHIGIRQGNPELLRWLDTFVFYNMVNGKLSQLTKKWLGDPLPANFPSL